MSPEMIMMAADRVGQSVVGNVKLISGLIQGRKAKQMASDPRPKYEIQQPVMDILDYTKSRANTGMSAGAKQVYEQQSERSLSQLMENITKNGGNLNNIADLYQAGEDGRSRFSLLDEQMRASNAKAYLDSLKTYGEELDKKWQMNVWAPWADKQQAAKEMKQQAHEKVWSGLSAMMGAGTNTATSSLYSQPQQPQQQVQSMRPITDNSIVSTQQQPSYLNQKVNPVMDKYPGLQLGYLNSMGPWQ